MSQFKKYMSMINEANETQGSENFEKIEKDFEKLIKAEEEIGKGIDVIKNANIINDLHKSLRENVEEKNERIKEMKRLLLTVDQDLNYYVKIRKLLKQNDSKEKLIEKLIKAEEEINKGVNVLSNANIINDVHELLNKKLENDNSAEAREIKQILKSVSNDLSYYDKLKAYIKEKDNESI